MSSSESHLTYEAFMAKHKHKAQSNEENGGETNDKMTLTHTRIASKEHNVYGGAFVIPKEELPTFWNLYYEHVFVKKYKEYLTEKQRNDGTAPLVVDFDFRYSYDINERQHTTTHIQDMIGVYLELLKEFYIFEEAKPFPVYIFEKPKINRLEDKSITKDGIHMLIGIQCDHTIQSMLREKVLKELPECWQDLPLINDWNAVLDEGISNGLINWPLFGSRKPGHDAYELTYHCVVQYDPADGEFSTEPRNVKEFNMRDNFKKLSVQYDGFQKFEMKPSIVDEFTRRKTAKKPKRKYKGKANIKIVNDTEEQDEDEDEEIDLNSIKNSDDLEIAINAMFKSFKVYNDKEKEFELRELHHYTQALPEKYYESGSHLLNRKVAFALKNTSEKLFFSWVMLRSKASDFDYNTIPSLYAEWKSFKDTNEKNVAITKRSIMYWVRKENYEEYERIKKESIAHYVEQAIVTGTEFDLACVLHKMFKDQFVCVSYANKHGTWYMFKNHRWVLDKGVRLRMHISKDMYELFTRKSELLELEMAEYTENDDKREYLKKQCKIINEVKIKMKRTTDKDHIMREAAEIFYDNDFMQNVNKNPFLLAFNNGVIDFKAKVFREGYPEDYITKTTGINYIPYEEYEKTHSSIISEIHDFMNKIFPIPDLNAYMWEHLASTLIGESINQTFNLYHGSGANGKSMLVELMSEALGEYKGTVPVNMVTDRRVGIGSTSSEVVQLKGVRYAVMQELTKGMVLNEGVMKELTSGDDLSGRGLYLDTEIFKPQFQLVVCTNNLFDINSNDDGTWRRIRRVPFPSKFRDAGEDYEDDTQYVFDKDKNLKHKFPTYAPIFASMLVKKAFETNGHVKDCETVLVATRKYRFGQDLIAGFISERIEKSDNERDKIGKTSLNQEFKMWFQQEHGTRKPPKAEELYEMMIKKFGPCSRVGWKKVRFVVPEEEELDIIDELMN